MIQVKRHWLLILIIRRSCARRTNTSPRFRAARINQRLTRKEIPGPARLDKDRHRHYQCRSKKTAGIVAKEKHVLIPSPKSPPIGLVAMSGRTGQAEAPLGSSVRSIHCTIAFGTSYFLIQMQSAATAVIKTHPLHISSPACVHVANPFSALRATGEPHDEDVQHNNSHPDEAGDGFPRTAPPLLRRIDPTRDDQCQHDERGLLTASV